MKHVSLFECLVRQIKYKPKLFLFGEIFRQNDRKQFAQNIIIVEIIEDFELFKIPKNYGGLDNTYNTVLFFIRLNDQNQFFKNQNFFQFLVSNNFTWMSVWRKHNIESKTFPTEIGKSFSAALIAVTKCTSFFSFSFPH